MIVGNLSALRQTNIVRLLAYSSIAQAGFMLVPFAAAGVAGTDLTEAFSATVIYLVIFAVMNLGAFAVVIAGARRTGTGDISGWAGLGSYDPRLGVLAAVFFFSLAGIPPLAGWFAKFVMFRSVIIAGGTATVVLAVIAAVNTVIAFYYYARVVKAIWLDDAPVAVLGDREAVPAGLAPPGPGHCRSADGPGRGLSRRSPRSSARPRGSWPAEAKRPVEQMEVLVSSRAKTRFCG